MLASKAKSQPIRDNLILVLATCFLAGFLMDDLSGIQVPGHLVRASAVLLICLSPLWRQLNWRQCGLAASPLLAWILWLDLASVGWDSAERALKGLFYFLAMAAVSSLLTWQQMLHSLRLTTALCLAMILIHIGPVELQRALTSPAEVSETGFRTSAYYTLLGIRLGLVAVLSTLPLLLDGRRLTWLQIPMTLLAWALLVVNGGTGSLIAAGAAVGMMLWLIHPRWIPWLLLVVAMLLIGIYLRSPERLDYVRLMSGRDHIYAESWPYLIDHAWTGAGISYFSNHVAPLVFGSGPGKYHEIYLEFWLAYGIVGMALLGVLIGFLTRQISGLLSFHGHVLCCGVFTFFLIHGLVDLHPLWKAVFASLLGMGIVLSTIYDKLTDAFFSLRSRRSLESDKSLS